MCGLGARLGFGSRPPVSGSEVFRPCCSSRRLPPSDGSDAHWNRASGLSGMIGAYSRPCRTGVFGSHQEQHPRNAFRARFFGVAHAPALPNSRCNAALIGPDSLSGLLCESCARSKPSHTITVLHGQEFVQHGDRNFERIGLRLESDSARPGFRDDYQIAMARVGPPEAPLCLGPPTIIIAPDGGTAARFARFSRPYLPAPSSTT